MGLFSKVKDAFQDLNIFRKGVTRGEKFLEGSTQAVNFSRLDERFFERAVKDWSNWDQLVADGTMKNPRFKELMTDIFMSLYVRDPTLKPLEDMHMDYHHNHMMLDEAMNLPLYLDARQTSSLNRLNSMIGAMFIGQSLLENMPEEPEIPEELKEELKDAVQQLRQANQDAGQSPEEAGLRPDLLQMEEGSGSGEPSELGYAGGDSQEDAETGTVPLPEPTPEQIEAQEKVEAAIAQIEAAKGDQGEARRAMREAMGKAVAGMENMDSSLRTWGTDPGELQRMAPEKAMDIQRRMQRLPNLSKFADEIGRFRELYHEAETEDDSFIPEELVDIDTSGYFPRLLYTEQVGLLDEDLQAIHLSRFMQHGSLSWEYGGPKKAGQGPLICCLDVSGSTKGDPVNWEKGFALALMQVCHEQERDMQVIFFDSEVHPQGVFTFRGGYSTLEDKIKVAEFFTGGGTSFQPPLDLAIQTIERNPKQWGKADIVLVTDGDGSFSDVFTQDFRERCKAKSVRVHGVLIDTNRSSIHALCDQVVSIRSLHGPEAARDLFSTLAKK
jgi:uncharacterized protein with von Willebrand factor type A (vWA) domain